MRPSHKPAEPGALPLSLLQSFSERIGRHLGLDFPEDRWNELARSAHGLAGTGDARAFLEKLLAVPWGAQYTVLLAPLLTNGETWFFREPAAFDALAQVLLPALRARGRRRLRIWSAGCSSGEEAWSIAMTLAGALPDLDAWDVRILATDINPAALEKAAGGVYRPWSFRACPESLRRAWFRPVGRGCHEVSARLRPLVRFRAHNLAGDGFPPEGAPDLIFCRNVLMYFRPAGARRIARGLGACLAEGGWLVTGAAEAGVMASSALPPLRLPGLTVFQRPAAAPPAPPQPGGSGAVPLAARELRRFLSINVPADLSFRSPAALRPPLHGSPCAAGRALQGNENPASSVPFISGNRLMALATGLADRGLLDAALVCCARALCRDRLDFAATHLQASIFLEQGRLQEAVAAFRRVLYIDPAHCLSQVSLGHLLLRQGRRREGARHLQNALALLAELAPETALAGAGGLLAGGLRASIEAQLASLKAA